MKRGTVTSKDPREESPGTEDAQNPSENMHYVSASRARQRDQFARNSWGGRRGIFGSCLSKRLLRLLIFVAFGFAAYSFAVSRGYLEAAYSLSKEKTEQNIEELKMGESHVLEQSDSEGDDSQSQSDDENEVEDDDNDDNDFEEELNKEKISEQNAVNVQEQPEALDAVENSKNYDHIFKYHVLQTLTNTDRMPHLKTRFEVCMKSILEKSSVDLLFFFVVDGPSKIYLEKVLQDITNLQISKTKFQFLFLDIDDLAKELAPLVEMMQSEIQGNHPYYKDSIFFLSTMLHMDLLPEYVHRVIMLDTDLKFMSDIKELFDHFDHFKGENIMGIVHEQQPVYRHIFSLYRSQNRGTRVGEPPPDGLTGFNSGVLLLDLDRMQKSEAYKDFLKVEMVSKLRDKFHFKGHLGDQDFYTLISMEKEDMFYNLPCSWNKQLCQWWKNKGYEGVWDQYYACNEKINIYHGNCNTPIPF